MGEKKDGEVKKKKKEKAEKQEDVEEAEFAEVAFERGPLYEYEDLLHRVHALIEQHNPALAGKGKKYMMKPPEIARVGSKKVGWVNFGLICGLMNRSTEHVMSYFMAEFGTEG